VAASAIPVVHRTSKGISIQPGHKSFAIKQKKSNSNEFVSNTQNSRESENVNKREGAEMNSHEFNTVHQKSWGTDLEEKKKRREVIRKAAKG